MTLQFINRVTLQGIIESDPHPSRGEKYFMCTFLLKIVDSWNAKDGSSKEFVTLIPINIRDEELYNSVKDDLKKGATFFVEGAFRKRAIQRAGSDKNEWISEVFVTKFTGWISAVKAKVDNSGYSDTYQDTQYNKPSHSARKSETKTSAKYDDDMPF